MLAVSLFRINDTELAKFCRYFILSFAPYCIC